ncbi:MAG: hypothetical protein DRP90_07435 [Planctomycetota bacterium]|nr:MAG: hypothetical protein DRP90_07435 [Planctomycetota bacterium]
MKVFHAIIGLILILGLIFAFLVFMMYKIEGDRWKNFVEQYRYLEEERLPPEGMFIMCGKLMEIEEYSRNYSLLLIQGYRYGKPAGEDYRFYALIETKLVKVKEGQLVRVTGYAHRAEDLPVVQALVVEKWFYPFIDLGFKK